MNSLLLKLAAKHRSAGTVGLMLAFLRRAKLFDYMVLFYFYRLPLEKLLRSGAATDVETRTITSPDHLDILMAVNEKDTVFRARLESGKFAVVLFISGEPIGYVWGQPQGVHLEERYGFKLYVAPEEVYSFDSFIVPDHRGKGLRRALANAFAEHAFYELGKKLQTSMIEIQNKHSVRVHESLGYERINLQVAAKFRRWNLQKVLKEY